MGAAANGRDRWGEIRQLSDSRSRRAAALPWRRQPKLDQRVSTTCVQRHGCFANQRPGQGNTSPVCCGPFVHSAANTLPGSGLRWPDSALRGRFIYQTIGARRAIQPIIACTQVPLTMKWSVPGTWEILPNNPCASSCTPAVK